MNGGIIGGDGLWLDVEKCVGMGLDENRFIGAGELFEVLREGVGEILRESFFGGGFGENNLGGLGIGIEEGL